MAGLRPRPYNLFPSLALIAYIGLKASLVDLGYSNVDPGFHALSILRF